MQDKSILFITNLHLWSLQNGKGGKAFYNTILGYKNAGWNIWFITTGGSVTDGFIEDDKLFYKPFNVLDKLISSRIRIISVLSRYIRLICINIYYYSIGVKILNKNKIPIIYAYEVDGVFVAKLLAKKYNAKLVTRFQGTVHTNTVNNLSNKIRKAPHLTALATDADICIMTDDGTQGLKTLHHLGNKSSKIFFWRNGVSRIDNNRLSKRNILREKFNYSNDFVFLTVSRLVHWKKVDRALRAFSIVHLKYSNVKLIIVGDGNERDRLVELANKLKISKAVEFVGAIPQMEVADYMIASDVFLSLYDISNVGNPLMEAMMCSKPIITLNVGDTNKIIVNMKNGILLNIEEIEKLPDFMINLYKNRTLRDELGNNALESVKSLFWDWNDRIESELKEVETLLYNY